MIFLKSWWYVFFSFFSPSPILKKSILYYWKKNINKTTQQHNKIDSYCSRPAMFPIGRSALSWKSTTINKNFKKKITSLKVLMNVKRYVVNVFCNRDIATVQTDLQQCRQCRPHFHFSQLWSKSGIKSTEHLKYVNEFHFREKSLYLI